MIYGYFEEVSCYDQDLATIIVVNKQAGLITLIALIE
jgi:hypothetical protein